MNRLKELREFHALTQEQCAKAAYISVKSYERYERGERVMPLDTAIFFAKFYKVSLDCIAGLAELPFSRPSGRTIPETVDDEIEPRLLFAVKRIPKKQQKQLADFLNSVIK